MKKISIIGNTGIVGSGISKYLFKKHKIFTFSQNKRLSDYKINLQYPYYLKNKILLNSDYIIFTAGIINEKIGNKQNKKILNNFKKLLKSFNGKLIYVSSSHVYGKKFGLVNEKTKKNPKDSYSKIHITYENLILDNDGIVLRANTVYGLYQNSNLRLKLIPFNFLVSAFLNNTIIINSHINYVRNFISNKSLGFYCDKIISDQKRRKIINAVGKNNLSLLQYAQFIKKFFKKKNKKINIEYNFKKTKMKNFSYKSIYNYNCKDRNDLYIFINSFYKYIKKNEKKFRKS